MTDINEEPVAPRPRGRPPGSGLRKPPQEPLRAEYTPEGKVIAYSSTGEKLMRKRPINSDLFHIPPEIIPAGFEYQWNVCEVLGQPQTAMMLAMAENGWRPVPAGRHKGMFMPAGYSENGDIIRDGLRLEERPWELNEEARQEERQKANKQVRDSQEHLGLTQKMPDGFSRDNANLRRMERQGTSRQIAPANDIPRPQLPIDSS